MVAIQVAGTDRMFLYGGGPPGYQAYAWLTSNGYSGTNLPNDFTSSYTDGHADNQGPWFATHSIVFKVVYNSQISKKEVFVKKSSVQGTGDPSF